MILQQDSRKREPMDGKKFFINLPEFDGSNVPVEVVARIMKKDNLFIRLGLQSGRLPIGTAFKKSEDGKQYDYYISPFLLWQYTGYIYKGVE